MQFGSSLYRVSSESVSTPATGDWSDPPRHHPLRVPGADLFLAFAALEIALLLAVLLVQVVICSFNTLFHGRWWVLDAARVIRSVLLRLAWPSLRRRLACHRSKTARNKIKTRQYE